MNLFSTIQDYFRSVIDETHKVVWPSRRQVIIHTAVVIGASIALIVIYGIIDYGLNQLVQWKLLGG